MAQYHLKRRVAPRTWPVLRKTTAWIARPRPKGHRMEFTLPAVVVMRDMLNLAQTAKQAKTLMREHEVRVNGTRIYKTDAAIAFMDLLTIGKDSYRIVLDAHNMLRIVSAKGEEFTLQRIDGKTSVRGNKTQLNCAGGLNVLVEKDAYKTGDSVAISPEGKIVEHYPLQKGASVLVIGGNHTGAVGVVDEIEGASCTIAAGKEKFQTTTKYAYVIGKDKPAIKLE